ncbi:hypothetical protein B0T18DRAFT_418807 [Schizothecium vesticola]|uniref:Uncharacterized protein n=1 Tax=Schizothecium vesticola TaxID=314040 RepID=A0AA40EK29_9PEZI|nr:hypothetical protein B0T18DRAFT_418807 [Schizothecium vesticola]
MRRQLIRKGKNVSPVLLKGQKCMIKPSVAPPSRARQCPRESTRHAVHPGSCLPSKPPSS